MKKILVSILLMCTTPLLFADAVAVFDHPSKLKNINEFVEYTVSDKPILTGTEVWQSERFADSTIDSLQYLHFRVNIKSTLNYDTAIWVAVMFPAIPKLYISDGNKAWLTGDSLPFYTRPIKAPNYYFPTQLKAGQTHQISGYMQGDILRYSFDIGTPQLINELQRKVLKLDMFFFGSMTLLILVAIVFFFITKQSVFLSFAAFSFAIEAWLFRVYGYGFEMVWPSSPHINDITYLLTVYGIMLSAYWICAAYLPNANKQMFGKRIFNLYALILPIGGLISFLFFDFKLTIDFPLFWFFPFTILLIGIIYVEIKRGSKQAKLFAIAMLPVVLGGVNIVSFVLGFNIGIDPKAGILNGLIVTSFLLIYSAASFLLKVLQEERDQQKQISELKTQQAQDLESLVNERTAELKQSNQKLKDLAHIDSLTKLPNRRSLDMFVDELEDKDVPIYFAILDLDHFKRVNDTHGHDVGDLVLCEIGKIFEPLIDDKIIAGRYGGEEFAIVAKETSIEGFTDTLNAIHAYINTTTISACPSLKIGACIGWVICHDINRITDAFKQADQALYQGKQAGRNKVIQYT